VDVSRSHGRTKSRQDVWGVVDDDGATDSFCLPVFDCHHAVLLRTLPPTFGVAGKEEACEYVRIHVGHVYIFTIYRGRSVPVGAVLDCFGKVRRLL
jgi:hypothetical protein